jgi:hypothetical protein
MLRSNICESLCFGLRVGQLNNGKWLACFARTALFACGIGPFRTGNRAVARVRSFRIWQKEAKFARCPFAKTNANCFNSFCHFRLISSVSRSQRPLNKMSASSIPWVWSFLELYKYCHCIWCYTYDVHNMSNFKISRHTLELYYQLKYNFFKKLKYSIT